MLIVSLDVDVGRRTAVPANELGPLAAPQDRRVRDARVEPDVEDVGLGHEVLGAKPAQIRPRGQEVDRGPCVPGVRPLPAKDRFDVAEEPTLLLLRVAPWVEARPLAVA